MKISSIEVLDIKKSDEEYEEKRRKGDGLFASKKYSLGNIVILAGKNGAGKTRLIKRLENYIQFLHGDKKAELYPYKDDEYLHLWIEIDDKETLLTRDNADKIELVNYSHYDALLQSANNFTPYVISNSKELLKYPDYGVTALNAFLLLEDMSHGYSPEFKDRTKWNHFVKDFLEPFGIKVFIDKKTKEPRFFDNLKAEKAGLSPGQSYLLRMAVACYCNEQNDKVIFVLDEPELHLHPEAQIKLIEKIQSKFPNAQLWVSTHSLTLISYLSGVHNDATLLYLSDGNLLWPRSNLKELLDGLLGTKENINSIIQLLSAPEEYACSHFAVQCMNQPSVVNPLPQNPENYLLANAFQPGSVILDYGAGKCRLLQEMEQEIGTERIKEITYIAFDTSKKYAKCAKSVMRSFGFSESNYYNNINKLFEDHSGKVDAIFLVNVLHEISTKEWKTVFSNFKKLLKDDYSSLIIVERAELTIGESPYKEGFLMITRNGANKLFGKNNYVFTSHPKKNYIVSYTIPKKYLSVKDNAILKCVNSIKDDAYKSIVSIKNSRPTTDKAKFDGGLKLAFQQSQFTNATLISDKMEKIIKRRLV